MARLRGRVRDKSLRIASHDRTFQLTGSLATPTSRHASLERRETNYTAGSGAATVQRTVCPVAAPYSIAGLALFSTFPFGGRSLVLLAVLRSGNGDGHVVRPLLHRDLDSGRLVPRILRIEKRVPAVGALRRVNENPVRPGRNTVLASRAADLER